MDQPSYNSHTGYPVIPETYASLEEIGLYAYGVCGAGTVLAGGTLNNVPPSAVVYLCASKFACCWDSPCEVVVGSNDMAIQIHSKGGVVNTLPSGVVVVGFADGVVWVLSENTPRELIYLFLKVETAVKYSRDDILIGYKI